MNKENKLVPKLRFPEFVNEGEWGNKSIGKVFNSFSGGTPNTSEKDYYGGKVPFIRSAEINKDETELYLTDKGLKNSSAKLVNKGDLLVALYGANSGDSAISKINGAINQAILCLQSDYSNSFVYNFLTLKKDWIVSRFIQGGQGNLSGDIVKSILIPFPTKDEQQKIASCLSSLDELIAAHTDKLEALKDHKKGLMQQLFPAEGETVPKLRFKEFEGDGEWSLKELGNIAENLDSKRIPITGTQREKGNIPYYGASGIIDYVKDYIFDDELLCISEDGANLIDRTYPIAFTINGKTWVNNHAHVLKFEKKCTQVLVENYLNAINLEDYLTGAAQPKLNQAKLSIITIPLPKPNEQQKIANFLSSLDDEIAAQAQKIEGLKEHKKGLMQGLFPSV